MTSLASEPLESRSRAGKGPLVTVIIVHFRGAEELMNCLNSLFKSSYDRFNVVLVDNGSFDGSVEVVRKRFGDKLRIIRSPKNLGWLRGNNLALSSIGSDYVVLLNNDTIVDTNWLEPLVRTAESDSTIAACQPKLLSLKQREYFEYNGACGGMMDRFGVPFTRGRIFELAERDQGQYDTSAEVFWGSGAALLLRYDPLKRSGYLDDLLHAHMDDIDLSWRLRLMGYKIVAVPASIVYHLGGNTPTLAEKTPASSKFFFKQRNNLIVLLKNYSYGCLLRFLPGRLVLDAVSAFYFAVKGDSERVYNIIAAYLSVIKCAGGILISRRKVQALRVKHDSKILGVMIRYPVAIQFYLQGRRKFSMLSGLPLPWETYVRKTQVRQSREPLLQKVRV